MTLRERAIATLPSRQCVDDDVLLYVARTLLAGGRPLFVMDTIVLAHALDQQDGKSRHTVAQDFTEAVQQQRLVVVPVYDAAHWSLLCYRPDWRQWYSMDSIRDQHGRGYHWRRHLAVLALLCDMKCLAAAEARILVYNDLPQQPGSYECARYVLFYVLVLLSVFARTDQEAEAQRELEVELRLVCEENRPAFEQQLVAHLRRMSVFS